MSYEEQANEIVRVKRFESGMVVDPVTINPENSLNEALIIKEKFNISGIPVVQRNTKKLVGILTNRDIRFAKKLSQPVESLMTKKNLVTVKENISMKDAQKLLHKLRIEKLLVVDKNYKCDTFFPDIPNDYKNLSMNSPYSTKTHFRKMKLFELKSLD